MSCPIPDHSNSSDYDYLDRGSSNASNFTTFSDIDFSFLDKIDPSAILLPLQWTIACIGIIGNILVVIIYKGRREKSPSEVFIVTMAVLDTLMCLFSIFFTGSKDYFFPKNCFWFCSAGNFAFDTVNTASAVLTLIVCINRYFAVCNPHSYRTVFADEKTVLILLFCILVSVLNCPLGLLMCVKFRSGDMLPCPCNEVIYDTPDIDILKLLWVLIRTLMLLVNAATMIYVYPKIFCSMKERSRRMRKLTSFPAMTSGAVKFYNNAADKEKMTAVVSICVLTQGCSSGTDKGEKVKSSKDLGATPKQSIRVHRDGKLTTTLVTVTIAYVTLMTPDIIVHVIDTFALLDNGQFDLIRTITQTLYLLNFVINPFIHFWVNSYFKSEVQRRFFGCKGHNLCSSNTF